MPLDGCHWKSVEEQGKEHHNFTFVCLKKFETFGLSYINILVLSGSFVNLNDSIAKNIVLKAHR